MAIYSVNKTTTTDYVAEDFAFEPGIEGALAIVAESEENYNRIMKAVGISELNYFEATGAEMVYEAGKLNAFFGKVKEFFEKLIKKVKGMYERFVQWLDQYIKNGEDFVKKYGNTLKNKKLDGFEYQGFRFTNLEGIDKIVFTKEKKSMQTTAELIKKCGDLKDYKDELGENSAAIDGFLDFYNNDYEDKLRGEILGNRNEGVASGEFVEKLSAYFRDGESGRKGMVTLKGDDVVKSLEHIKTAKKDIEAAKKAMKTIQENIQKVIDELKTLQKKLESNVNTDEGGKVVAVASKGIAVYKSMMNINVTVKGAYLAALRDRNKQARSMCFKALGHKAEEEQKPAHEGFMHFTEGFLDNVILK